MGLGSEEEPSERNEQREQAEMEKTAQRCRKATKAILKRYSVRFLKEWSETQNF